MKQASYSAIVLTVPILLFGCATGRNAAPAPPIQAADTAIDESIKSETTPPAPGLRQALKKAIDNPSAWDSLHLLIKCAGDDGMRTMEVHGNGIGIWGGQRQFTLPPAEISSLLQILDKAGFTQLADIYGGNEKSDPPPPKEEAGGAIRIICRVVLSLDGHTKQVAQIGKGEQSAELKQVAENLLDQCAKPGQSGIAVADLGEGLGKLSRGELAPETFQVLLHRKPQAPNAEPGGDGFLLLLQDSQVTTRGYDAAANLLDPLSLTLSPAEITALARELDSLKLAQLPINLFAQNYTDLTIDVLNHKKSVQARQFAGMTSTTHGERQIDFDLIYDTLHQLHVRVLSEGEPTEKVDG